MIKIIRTKENSVFGVIDIYGIKLFTHLRLNFSHLNEHKFRHNCCGYPLLQNQVFKFSRCFWKVNGDQQGLLTRDPWL